MPFDEVLKVRTDRHTGNLAQFTEVVAQLGGLIEEIETLHISKDHTVREITIGFAEEEDRDALLAQLASIPGISVLERKDRVFQLHEGGKVGSHSRVAVDKLSILRSIHVPGVLRVCQAIAGNPALARRYTSIGNTVAVVSNGTHVHGLGEVGPAAVMPVLEGKAALYSQLVGLAGVPLVLGTRDPDELVETVARVAPSFGGIHLECLASMPYAGVAERLDALLPIPVVHSERHGPAVTVLAALIKACRDLGESLRGRTVAQLGLGTAGRGIAELLLGYGVDTVLAADPRPERLAGLPGLVAASLEQALAGADIVVAATGVPGLIGPERIRTGQIIIALSSPKPEIEPEEALAAGARFAADSSQLGAILGLPGLLRGALEAGATRIDHAMMITAAEVIASLAEDELLPDPLDRKMHRAVADAVARAATSAAVERPA